MPGDVQGVRLVRHGAATATVVVHRTSEASVYVGPVTDMRRLARRFADENHLVEVERDVWDVTGGPSAPPRR